MSNYIHLNIASCPIKLIVTSSKWCRYLSKYLKPFISNQTKNSLNIYLNNNSSQNLCNYIVNSRKHEAVIYCPSSLRYFKRFNDFFKIAFSQLLTYKEGFLLHASSLIIKDKGSLFIGRHGAGKSTLLKLAKPVFLPLNDDYAIIRKIGHDFFVFGSPFKEKNKVLMMNRGVKIVKIFFIYKSKTTSISQVNKKEAYIKLFRNILAIQVMKKLNRHYPDLYLKKLLRMVTLFINNIPTYNLYFTKDKQFLKYL